MADPRWRTLQIADSAFPTGGFAHSAGLEAAASAGAVPPSHALEAYVRAHLWNVGSSALPFAAAAHDDPAQVWPLDALADARLTSHVANRASRTQGRAFLSTVAAVFDDAGVRELAQRARSGDASVHLAPVFGAVLSLLGVERSDALAVFLLLSLRGVASAAVRLGIVGPHESQRIQTGLAATLDAVLSECERLPPSRAAGTSPISDLLGATHDRLHAHLFQS